MVSVNHVNIHRQPRHVLNEEIDRRSTFHREKRRLEDRGSAFEQQTGNLDVGFVHHGFSTSVVPSLRRAVQRLCPGRFPTAFFAAAAHGRFNSSARPTQSRTTLTRRQFLSSVANTSGRSDLTPSMILRASSIPW